MERTHFTSFTYQLKRDILSFSNKISNCLSAHLAKGAPKEALNTYLALLKKWISATELRNRRKGNVKLPLFYKGKMHEAYISHVKVQITASRKDIYLVLVTSGFGSRKPSMP